MRKVGVEEELLLVDAATGAPTAAAGDVLTSPGGGHQEHLGRVLEQELQQQQLELGTPPVAELTALDTELRSCRRAADERARAAGARVAALATSPLPVRPQLTPKSRYLQLAERLGLTATEQLTGGCHVHVDVADDEEGVAVLDRIRIWLPVLLALSANSPYWQGEDSGYDSFRSQAWSRFPTAGPAEVLGSAAAYHRRAAELVGSGVLLDRAMIYYDARLSHSYPTVEIRVADVCLFAEDSVLVAGLARGLVETAAREAADGTPPPPVPTELIRLATWRAGRSGLSGDLLDPYTCRPRPAPEVLTVMLDHVRPALRDTGDEDLVSTGLERVCARGNGARVQRRLAGGSADLTGLTRAAVEITVGGGDR